MRRNSDAAVTPSRRANRFREEIADLGGVRELFGRRRRVRRGANLSKAYLIYDEMILRKICRKPNGTYCLTVADDWREGVTCSGVISECLESEERGMETGRD